VTKKTKTKKVKYLFQENLAVNVGFLEAAEFLFKKRLMDSPLKSQSLPLVHIYLRL
jgi:hypothetical protein